MPLRKKQSKKDLQKASSTHIPLTRTITSEHPPQLPSLPYTLPPPIPTHLPLPIPTKQSHRRSRSFSNYTHAHSDQPWRSHDTWRAYQVGSGTTREVVEGLEVPSARRDGAGRGWRGRGGGGFFGNDGERVDIEKLGAKGVLSEKIANKVMELKKGVIVDERKVERINPNMNTDRWAPGTATMLYRMKSQTNLRSTTTTDHPPFPLELQTHHKHFHQDTTPRSTILSSSTLFSDDLPPLLPSSQSQASSPPSSLNSHHSPPQIIALAQTQYTPHSRYPTRKHYMEGDVTMTNTNTNLIVDLPPLLPGEISRQSSFTSTGERNSGERPVPWGRKTPSERERRSVSPAGIFDGGEGGVGGECRGGGIVLERSDLLKRGEGRGREKRDVGVGMWMAGMGVSMGGVARTGVVLEKKGKSMVGGKGGWI